MGEPELGIAFGAKTTTQLNLRLADKPSVLFPKMTDVLMPVWWHSSELMAPAPLLHMMVQLQGAPGAFQGLMILAVVAALIILLIGCCLCGCGVQRYRKAKNADKEDEF